MKSTHDITFDITETLFDSAFELAHWMADAISNEEVRGARRGYCGGRKNGDELWRYDRIG